MTDIIAASGFDQPTSCADVFRVLGKEGVLDTDFAATLEPMARMPPPALVVDLGLRCARMRQEWSTDELVSAWTLVDEDWALVGNKTGVTRLGFSVLLKFFEIEARFPQHDSSRFGCGFAARGLRAGACRECAALAALMPASC